MGIPYFFYNLYKKYNQKSDLMINEHDISSMNINYLFLDYNSMIHPCSQNVNTKINNNVQISNDEIEEMIINECILYTQFIINVINANNIYIMIDGVAPMAKISQQRERRYKSYIFKKISNDKESDSDNSHKWDSNKITPGTKFMEKLSERLSLFINENTLDSRKFILSDSNEPGEGEHKMMRIINNLDNIQNVCIYGLDADLIMLSLLNKNYNKIILLRDNTFNTKAKEDERKFTYLNIKNLTNAITNEIRSEYKHQNNKNSEQLYLSDQQLIQDYVFLCIFLGNDFLHNIPSLIIKENAANVLLKSYIKSLNNKPLINNSLCNQFDNLLNLELFMKILYELAMSEDYFFRNVYSVYKKPTKIYKDEIKIDDLPNDNIICYINDYIQYNKPEYKTRYYIYYNMTNINQCCHDYLEGILWVWGYYNSHNHDNWSWSYKHHSTPFISDIYNYLYYNIEHFKKCMLVSNVFKKSEPILSIKQLLIVLPRESLINIINDIDKELCEKLIRLFKSDSKVINDLFPKKITLDMINKEYLWQSKVFFEKINIKQLNYLLN